jgi:hypothetical protein
MHTHTSLSSLPPSLARARARTHSLTLSLSVSIYIHTHTYILFAFFYTICSPANFHIFINLFIFYLRNMSHYMHRAVHRSCIPSKQYMDEEKRWRESNTSNYVTGKILGREKGRACAFLPIE